MRCSQGPGAPDGASSGQDGAALARCRLAAGITARAIDLVAAAAITLAPSKVRFGPLGASGAAAAATEEGGMGSGPTTGNRRCPGCQPPTGAAPWG